jgi:periplasmic copper chaperone A
VFSVFQSHLSFLKTPFFALSIASCVVSATSFAKPTFQAEKPWVMAVPPSAQSTAAYVVLRNTSKKPQKLVSASTPFAKVVELHTHEMKDGMASMKQVSEWEVPASGEIKLEPKGHHLMLIGLTAEFHKQKVIPIELVFEDKGTLQLRATIQKPSEKPDHSSASGAHH